MKKAIVVIGMNYGDEGKGLMVDYFASKNPGALVVRFNGTCQSGRTVETKKLRHVFGHFGSGTLCSNPTYLSEFYAVHPMIFAEEYNLLAGNGYAPITFRDKSSLVITPFDVIINQASERKKYFRQGTCGVGFFAAIKRNEKIPIDIYTTRAKLSHALKAIAYEYLPEVLCSGPNRVLYETGQPPEKIIEKFLDDVEFFKYYTSTEIPSFDTYIFEGGQGLQLDQSNNSNFPFLTPSNTGLTNVIPLLKKFGITDVEVVYVTRTYFTRHGAGPLPNETEGRIYEGIEDDTNIPNEFQGTIRYAPLDFNMMIGAIHKDLSRIFPLKNTLDIKVSIVMTCLDQTKWVKFKPVLFDEVTSIRVGSTPRRFAGEVSTWLTPIHKIYESHGPTRDAVTEKIIDIPLKLFKK